MPRSFSEYTYTYPFQLVALLSFGRTLNIVSPRFASSHFGTGPDNRIFVCRGRAGPHGTPASGQDLHLSRPEASCSWCPAASRRKPARFSELKQYHQPDLVWSFAGLLALALSSRRTPSSKSLKPTSTWWKRVQAGARLRTLQLGRSEWRLTLIFATLWWRSFGFTIHEHHWTENVRLAPQACASCLRGTSSSAPRSYTASLGTIVPTATAEPVLPKRGSRGDRDGISGFLGSWNSNLLPMLQD